MSEQAVQAGIARTISIARAALDKDGLSDASLHSIQEALRQLAMIPGLTKYVELQPLHGGEASFAILASEGSQGLTLMLALFGAEAPTPIHDHGTWGAACVVSGEDHYMQWERVDDGDDLEH